MAEERVQRCLAAILVADVAGGAAEGPNVTQSGHSETPPGTSVPGGRVDEIGTKADVGLERRLLGGIAPWKAHEVRWPGMAASVKLSQQPRTESCVVPGNGHFEA